MKILEKYDWSEVDLKNHLQRVGDIINIEGPLLSLFQDKRNKDLYLFDWIDSDDKTNRWLIYKIPAELLNQFLLHRISYKTMFNSLNENKFYYADIINADKIEYLINNLHTIPQEYIPTKEAYFDVNDSPEIDKIFLIVDNILNEKTGTLNQINFYEENKNLNFLMKDEEFGWETDTKFDTDDSHDNVIIIKWTSKNLETQPHVRESNRIFREQGVGLY